MSITVNTNMQALRIQSNLNSATDKMNTAMERMASGSKINSAKDDAAGLAVSTTLSKTISSSKVASDNVKMGQDLLSTAEGTLDVIMTNVVRIRDLTEQASNGTYSAADKVAIAAEVKARVAQITSLSTSATFNGTSLFAGTGTAVSIQSGTGATSQTTLASSIFADAGATGSGLFNVVGAGTAAARLQVRNAAGNAYIDVYERGAGLYTYVDNNADPTVNAANRATAVSDLLTDLFAGNVTLEDADTNTYAISSFLNSADSAVANVTTRQTQIGAAQNQLQAVMDGLEVQVTNLASALSTIKDADVAQESASYVQSQILQQASASLLVQANSAPQIALTLIKG